MRQVTIISIRSLFVKEDVRKLNNRMYPQQVKKLKLLIWFLNVQDFIPVLKTLVWGLILNKISATLLPTQCMDIFICFHSVFVVLCVGSGFATG
jgi:hypothetical protein